MDIILHIPHSSTHFPFLEGFVISNTELNREIQLLTDWFTDDLFDSDVVKVTAPFSRIFCDVERFPVDADEVMSQYGMGMCYTHLDNGRLMRNLDPETKSLIKTEYYDLHHKLMEEAVSGSLRKNNKVLIIDCHSFPDIPLGRDLNKDMPRPDFCIGTDECHTPDQLTEYCLKSLSDKGYSVKLNNPYSGTYVPLKYLQKDNRVMSIMIEINRKLYLDQTDSGISKSDNYQNIKTVVGELIASL